MKCGTDFTITAMVGEIKDIATLKWNVKNLKLVFRKVKYHMFCKGKIKVSQIHLELGDFTSEYDTVSLTLSRLRSHDLFSQNNIRKGYFQGYFTGNIWLDTIIIIRHLNLVFC